MVKHFTNKVLKRISNLKPKFVYCCPPGAMGPSGLVAALYKTDQLYVANLNRLDNDDYKKLLENIFSSIPEFKKCVGNILNVEYKRETFSCYEHIYLGCGNMLAVTDEFQRAKQFKYFSDLRDFFEKLAIDPYEVSMNEYERD